MASKPCSQSCTVSFPNVFKLFRHRVNASSNFAAVTFLTVFRMCWHRVNVVFVCQNRSCHSHIIAFLQKVQFQNCSELAFCSGANLIKIYLSVWLFKQLPVKCTKKLLHNRTPSGFLFTLSSPMSSHRKAELLAKLIKDFQPICKHRC